MIMAKKNSKILDDYREKLERLLSKEYETQGLRKLPGQYFFFDDILKLPDFRSLTLEELRLVIHGDSQIRFSARGSKVRMKPHDLNRHPDTRLSKKLAWLLRHGAESVSLTFNEGGYLYIDDILRLKEFGAYCLADFMRVVKYDEKGRYELHDNAQTGRPEIRATQGHSLKVEGLDLRLITDPTRYPVVVHGTYFKNWPSIKVQGLGRLARNHIHFAVGEPGQDGVISGMRGSAEVLIYIDVARAMRDGFQFFVSQNNVVLCPGDANGFLPVTYFRDVYQRRPRMRLPL